MMTYEALTIVPHSKKKKTLAYTRQVAIEGLIASAVTKSLNIQHLEREGVGVQWLGEGELLDDAVRAASLIFSVSALVSLVEEGYIMNG